jgi:plastocyanin
MHSRFAVSMLAWLALAGGCSGSPSGPSGGGSGGGGGGASAAAVTVGNIFFRSVNNASQNPAVDTVPAGSAATWTWTGTGSVPHSVESEGSPSFASSAIQTGDRQSYSVTFPTPGTYRYDCAVHGQLMSGTIVVR